MRSFLIVTLLFVASLGTPLSVSAQGSASGCQDPAADNYDSSSTGYDGCIYGTLKPNGVGCFASKECSSGYCDGTTETCKDPNQPSSSPGTASTINDVLKNNSDALKNIFKSGGIQTGAGGANPSRQTGAGGANPGPVVTLINPLGSGVTLSSFLLSILSIITDTIGPVIVILMLVFVGFKFVVAQGSPDKISEARQMLLWTVVGALILLGAKVIALGIQATVQALQ